MRTPVYEKEVADKKLLHDDKTYGPDGREYLWKQTQEELEISFTERKLSREEARSARVVIKSGHLFVSVQGETVFDDDLWESIRTDESTWTVVDGVLVVQLSKIALDPPERNNWPRCGKSEPHKYDKEYKAKLARREARQQARERAAEAEAEKALEEAIAGAAAEKAVAAPEESSPVVDANTDDMPELEDYVPLAERSPALAVESSPDDMPELEDHIPLAERPSAPQAEISPSNVAVLEGSPTARGTSAEMPPLAKDEAEDSEAESEPRQRVATTSTKALLARRKQQESIKEDLRWKKGTKAEEFERIRPKGLGPQSLAESRRRGEVPLDQPT